MNKLTIIGNLTRAPELRTTQSGISVCSFTVAVNRRKTANNADPAADYFRVTAWRQLGENCDRYLDKGRKVAVVGPVSVSTYTANDGTTRANLEITAEDVEFLSSRAEEQAQKPTDSEGNQSTGQREEEGKGPFRERAAQTYVGSKARPEGARAYAQMDGYQEVTDEDLPF